MRTKLAVSFTLTLAFMQVNTIAQSVKVKAVDNIYINTPDSILHFQISKIGMKADKLNSEKRYYWYKTGVLSSNKGGYAGFLLDGKYLIYDMNKRLREEGQFNNGLKVGLWKRWYSNGEYESTTSWKAGFKHGKSSYYNMSGALQKSISYKNDVINGDVVLYMGNRVEKVKYKNGTLIRPKEKAAKQKKSFFGRLFKRDTTLQKKKLEVKVRPDTQKKDTSWYRSIFIRKKKNAGEKVGK